MSTYMKLKIRSGAFSHRLDIITPRVSIIVSAGAEMILLRQSLIDCQVAAAEGIALPTPTFEITKTMRVLYKFFPGEVEGEDSMFLRGSVDSFMVTIDATYGSIALVSLFELERVLMAIEDCMAKAAQALK